MVDDEPLAREKVIDFLRNEADIEVIGEATNGLEALEKIKAERPDLVFLDINMPELNGFEILEQLEDDENPLVVFVTAYDEHAVKAFEYAAADYLLKPFDRDRFYQALESARARQPSKEDDQLKAKVLDIVANLSQQNRFRERIVVKSEGRVIFVNTREIDWIEAAGNYARLHVGEEAHLIRETMIGLERKLSPEDFVRIHRSAIVNVHRISEMQPLFHGEYLVILKGGTQLTLSRCYRENLQRLLGDQL